MRISANDTEFDVDADSDLLAALAAHGICARFSCRNGNCGVCEASLNSGTVWLDDKRAMVSAPARILLCRAFARADLVLTVTPRLPPVSRYCRVQRVDRCADGYEVELRLPAGRVPPMRADDAIGLDGCVSARVLQPRVLPSNTQRSLLLQLRDDDGEWLAAVSAGEVRVWLPVPHRR